MSKIKRIVPFILAVCMVFSLCFTLACSTSKELNSISLNTANAKVDFSLGEEYRPTGLVVTANYKSGKSEVVSTESVTINTDAYDAYTVGTYDIKVSYTSEGTTAEASYKVNVVEALSGGLVVTLRRGFESRIDLSANSPTTDFSDAARWIEVRKPDASGEVDMNSAALSRDSYTVGVYKNGVAVTNLSAANRGIYQIVASMYDEKEDFTYEGFTLITVFDDVKSLAFSGTAADTTQAKGLRETMTPKWKFTVTFNSGDTEVVDKTNPYLSIPRINPNTKESTGTVKVTYREPKILEAPATSVGEVEVNYTLTGDQKNPDMAFLNFSNTDNFTISNDAIGNVDYDATNATYNIVGGKKGVIVSKSATIELPTGIAINNSTTWSASQAYQSGGASSAADGRYINFTLDRNCEIYVYAKSNGADARCMALETEGDYAFINTIEGYFDITGVATAVNENYSAHAVSVTGLDSQNPARFELSFDASINVFGILIIFPEDMQ